LTVLFHNGIFLIKAPIGTGKSFLFFDAPVYGLYKHEPRQVLNIRATTGYVKLLVRVHDTDYLIIRQLRKGKQKTSCTSQIFTVSLKD